VTHFNWTPRIGDPTIGDWVTVVLYRLAAGSCWISARKLGLEDVGSNERRAPLNETGRSADATKMGLRYVAAARRRVQRAARWRAERRQ
jgi:hypothetical protein